MIEAPDIPLLKKCYISIIFIIVYGVAYDWVSVWYIELSLKSCKHVDIKIDILTD